MFASLIFTDYHLILSVSKLFDDCVIHKLCLQLAQSGKMILSAMCRKSVGIGMSSFLDSSDCFAIYFVIADSVTLPIVAT